MRIVRALSVLAGLLLIFPVAGCGLVDTGPSAKDVATAFVSSFAAGDSAAAARRTDSPEAARQLLAQSRKNLSPKFVTAKIGDVVEGEGQRPTTVRATLSWNFGKGRVWSYETTMELVRGQEDWVVRWAPSVIHPELAAQQTLEFRTKEPNPAPILGRNGVRMMGPEKLVRVTVVPQAVGQDAAGVATSLAEGLNEVAPSITKQDIMQGIADTPADQAYSVVTLRWADYERVKPEIYELPGVRFPTHTDLVTAERDYGSQVLPTIAEHLQKRVGGAAGWSVVTRNAAGKRVQTLHHTSPKPAKAVRTTLSDRVQKAAEKAVDPLSKAAMIVAMKPSSGELLAVAQNAEADRNGVPALTGQYPPGSTFKIVTALAALESGRVDMNTPVKCPATTVVNGREIPNSHHFDLGTVPLRTAFAKSCNTTFAQIALDLPAGALTTAARQLGVGANFVIPGITTITGKVPRSTEPVQRASNGFGQGKVLASPFGMAMVTASVANGDMPTPKLVTGSRTKITDPAPEPPSRKSMKQLRAMMREVVKTGTATELAGAGSVAGKTGTAQYGDGTHAHGWFVGYRGDMAFAVLLTDAGTSEKAVAVARTFLENT
ncbi:penicillin-binding transpeptidase domain-containing protein [Haloactinomyces albus]|uniref:Beta-lactamase n=1 Tax=Haloactinomyces albus TaxID=1352928 RepID=A0AAE3Z999_9ACTN|nr:penicillin-binding transpeptidase domain-containing protein [Haloactinomyces albus]MDR7300692.1 beta-lactamase class D [Haloactinomyces albus]